ncbi:UPF0340 protein ywlG [Levilactobacillus zymae]|jgi:TIGR01440 family protein|uniref:UPF0340 protein LZY01_24060 n=1 Tax=Levilactobacillus zymae TaxID=267363 RepID=A0ABQ0X094_9LACO|nr:TIGR01440 family protein [Levilactobacillus zymae]KRL08199.1 hypothetical protein FD38_GL002444 [Levilactobacillus zymae DSM 19395]QFR61772.1 TIGR01440 family protein [Levilactobacillus zymae]GEO73238.1 UPF0340 protein ywlG [Levilactobacillus zymae]
MTTQNLATLETDVARMVQEVLAAAKLRPFDLFVLGCSTSEVVGGQIGQDSNPEVGARIIKTVLAQLRPHQLQLAVQGCEHINRSLVVERRVADEMGFEIVNVVPAMHAGGACSVAAFQQFKDPVEVEHVVAQAGLDIGDTAIGMHVKFVQVPVRPTQSELGGAHVTALRSRPKYVGGPRATYATV